MTTITTEEALEIKNILNKFFPKHIVDRLRITHETYIVLEQILLESGKCTSRMHFVPTPGTVANPARYFTKQARDMLKKHFLTDEGRHYFTCMKVVGRNYIRQLQLASEGLL